MAHAVIEVLDEVVAAVQGALGGLADWGLAGTKPGQYRSDLAADEAALAVLDRAGVGVLSEESGLTWPEREIVVVVDPVDGSTNASRGIPWYATSLCAVDADGPLAAVVVNLATGTRFDAVRGEGARCDGRPVAPRSPVALGDAVVGLSGHPARRLGWRQFRALGACALDLCAVASGGFDAYIDCSRDAHGCWDYLGGTLVCWEAGVIVEDASGRGLVVLDHAARRTPLAATSASLFGEVSAARSSLDSISG